MQTRTLRTLTRIAQVRSFATAAAQLNMTVSAVSMQMKSLEQELGAELFNRRHRPPKLTPLGMSVANHASQLLVLEEALIETCSPSDQLVGRFSIGFVTTTSVRLLPRFLKQSAILAPNARFVFESGLSEALEEKVVNGQIDAAIVTASGLASPHLDYNILYEEPFTFAAYKNQKNLSLETLIRTTAFLHFMPNTGIGKIIAEHMEKISATIPVQNIHHKPIVLDSVEAIMECVKQGIGFTLLPKPDVDRYADSNIVVFSPKATQLNRKLVLVTARDGHMRSKIKQLKQLFFHTEL